MVGAAIAIIPPAIQAGLQLATFIQSSYALWQSGRLTDQQLQDMWKSAGVAVQAADKDLQAAEDAAQKPPGAAV